MFYTKIDLLMTQGRYADAEREIRRALEDDMEDPYLFYLLSMALFNRERPKDAEQCAREAIALDAEFQLGHFALAKCLIERGRWGEAHAALDEAGRLDPDDADVDGLRAQIHSFRGRPEKAREAATAGLSKDPDNEICRFYGSLSLAKLGRHEEADSAALELLSDAPEEADHHNIRGWTMVESGNSRQAQEHFVNALRLDPENEDARFGLAHALKLSNPLIGWILRGLMRLERVSVWKLLAGAAVLYFITRQMRDSSVAGIATTGHLLHALAMLVVFASLILHLLTDAVLATSRAGRLALSANERTALKWAAAPLALGAVFMVLWLLSGARSAPYLAITWLSVAALAAECFESNNRWVRTRMVTIAALAGATALWCIYAQYFVLRPKAFEILHSLGELSPESLRESKDALSDALLTPMVELSQLRKTLLGNPAIVLILLAAFRDDVRHWFQRRAPDDDDEAIA